MLADLVAQAFHVLQTCLILLGGDDALRRRHVSEGAVYQVDILLAEGMMISEDQGSQVWCQGCQVVFQLLGRGYAGQQQHVGVLQVGQLGHLAPGLLEDAAQCTIFQGGEEELLVGIECHGFRDDAILHGFQLLGTFGHDDDVCPVLAVEGLAQPSRRQQLVIDDESVVVYQQDIDAGFDIAVLEGVI